MISPVGAQEARGIRTDGKVRDSDGYCCSFWKIGLVEGIEQRCASYNHSLGASQMIPKKVLRMSLAKLVFEQGESFLEEPWLSKALDPFCSWKFPLIFP